MNLLQSYHMDQAQAQPWIAKERLLGGYTAYLNNFLSLAVILQSQNL